MTRLDRFWLEDRRVWIKALADILIAADPDWPDQVIVNCGRERHSCLRIDKASITMVR